MPSFEVKAIHLKIRWQSEFRELGEHIELKFY